MTVTIRGGTVVDGTGAPPVRADVVIEGTRIAGIGAGAGGAGADTVIDATGMLVAPGFVDLHTHYDAQLFWDPNASPSPLHGVTTVLGGNCGFSLAPMAPEHVDYISRMMARVEGMPLAALRAGVPWDWSSFGDWLGRLDGRIAVNAGFLVGHSTLRRLVMGERAVGGAATERDIDAMEAALHAALAEGALGFSTSQVHTHNDGDGQPVPSRAAAREEMERLAAAVREHEGTTDGAHRRRLPQRLQRGGHRLPGHHVAAGGPPGQLERPGRLGHERRGCLEPAGRRQRRRRPRGDRPRPDAAPHHAAAVELRARRHPRRAPGVAGGLRPPASRAHRRRCRTRRPAAGSTPARSRTRRAYCGTSRCGSASSSTRPSPPRMPARRARAWGRWRGSAALAPFDALLDIVVADRPAYGPAAAHPRIRGGLAVAGGGLAGPAGHRRRIRCRRPPRHHVRRHLLHVHAGRRGAGTRPAQLGAGGTAADRRPGPTVRVARPWPARGRARSPMSWCSIRRPSAMASCGPATTCRAGPAASMPTPWACGTSW